VRLTVGTLADVREATGFDLAKTIVSESDLSDLLFADPARLVAVLFVVCEPDVKARQVTPEEFAHLFVGPTLGGAGEALLGAIADFFPRSRVGAAIRANLTATLDRMDRMTIERIEAIASTSNGGRGN